MVASRDSVERNVEEILISGSWMAFFTCERHEDPPKDKSQASSYVVYDGLVAQLVSHWACNREVAGSIPSCAASCGVSVIDALLTIALDLCSPSVDSAECSRNRM